MKSDGAPQYIMWRFHLKDWLALKEDFVPEPEIWNDWDWIEACMPADRRPSSALDNFVRHTQWRMLVFGMRGSGMFLHADGLRTSTWQAQLFGRKRFVLCAPDQKPYLYSPGDINVFNPDYARFPEFRKAKCSDILLHPGDVLYYPNGYYHMTKVVDEWNVGITGRAINEWNYEDFFLQLKDDCENPGRDVSLEYPGASQNLYKPACDVIDTCRAAWHRKYTLKRRPRKPVPQSAVKPQPAAASTTSAAAASAPEDGLGLRRGGFVNRRTRDQDDKVFEL